MKMDIKVTIVLLLLTTIIGNLATAQELSDDGSTYSTNSDGRLVRTESLEVSQIQIIIRLRGAGSLDGALSLCNGLLSTNAANRWAILERMDIYGDMGQEEKAETDFQRLTQLYPNFVQAYNTRATQLLRQPMPKNRNHPIVDWLNSADNHKRTAASAIVNANLKFISEHGMEWLNSQDGRKQQATMEVIQAVMRATANPKFEKKQ
jgi:predicted Zn-dependent protease